MELVQSNRPIARVHYIARVKCRAPEGIYYYNVPWPPPRQWYRAIMPDPEPLYTDAADMPDLTTATVKKETFHMTRWRSSDPSLYEGYREWVEYIHESDWPMDTEKTLCDHPRQLIFKRMDGFDPVAAVKRLWDRLNRGE